ncbi:beta-ketoacyl synthase N-terminal-like domain-containing protein [Cystobacter ferrugineus]|nr:beta-ketoacyl synthase N-terminal-like domain-containing protein [Cystobacter ferrugineus]
MDTLESVPLKGHAVRGLTDGFDGSGRLLRLGDSALADLIEYSGLGPEHHPRTGFFVCLPGHFYSTARRQFELLGEGPAPDSVAREELRSHFEQRQRLQDEWEQRLVPSLLSLNRLTIPPTLRTCFLGGPAVFAQAVVQAVRRLRSRELDRCIVGGIDSYVHGGPLADVYELGLLRTEEKPSGFFPGEAGAFVLLERADAARARGARIEGMLGPSSIAEESFDRFSDEPPQGGALTSAIETCLRETEPRPGLAIVNINGDEFRARDFGTTLMRIRGSVLPEDFRQWYPVESFGEIGVATGAASVCLVVRAFVRGYAGSRSALVMLLGDDEARSAMLIEDLPLPSGRAR